MFAGLKNYLKRNRFGSNAEASTEAILGDKNNKFYK